MKGRLIALALVALLLLGALVFGAAAANKKVTKPPSAPRITAAQRAAAREQIARDMEAAGYGFENPEALEPFFAALSKPQPVHILQFGDSHTASDDWVDSMRTLLQTKFGNGGPGFVQAGRPYKGYRRFDARGNSSAGWITEGTMAQRGDPNQGLSGISISTHLRGQTVTLSGSGESLSLFYMHQPGGGQVDVTVDAQDMGPLATEGEGAPGLVTYPVGAGPHEIALRTLDSAPVRLFGWALDNAAGLTFETLGINGAQANVIPGWEETLWSSAMAARNPALVILAYGTNEANSAVWTREQYRADMAAVIAKVRRAAMDASILMIGPPDCGRLRPLRNLSEVIAAQREIAREQGVAFWDWRRHEGGAGAVRRFVTAGYGQADYIHMTSEGYRLTGEAIVRSMMREWEKRHEQAGQNQ